MTAKETKSCFFPQENYRKSVVLLRKREENICFAAVAAPACAPSCPLSTPGGRRGCARIKYVPAWQLTQKCLGQKKQKHRKSGVAQEKHIPVSVTHYLYCSPITIDNNKKTKKKTLWSGENKRKEIIVLLNQNIP